jgi:phosphomannomutase
MNTHIGTGKKHLFFDMDDTVTLTRSRMDDDVYDLFSKLPHDIIIVSGAHIDQIHHQVRGLPFYRLGQNGNQAVHPDTTTLWEEILSDAHTARITEHIAALSRICALPIENPDDLIEHRGAQISYSIIGHHEETAKKKVCDPAQEIRRSLLAQVPFDCDDVEVKIGGTTCFDYFMKGRTKGYNITRLIEHTGWNAADCIYFGDSLFPGGNDESVIGVIETVSVRDHRHTFELLNEYFLED